MNVYLPLIWVGVGILLLIVFNLKFKMHNLISLTLVAIIVGILEKMKIGSLVTTLQTGLGSTLGALALIVVFGAIIGKLMIESGASQKIANTIIDKFGIKYLPWGLLIIGVIFGMSMFYEVAFLITAPLVVSIAREAKIPYMKLVIPTVAGATMGHSLFPPQPGPMALVTAFNVDIGQVYILGLIVIIPAIIFSGIVLPKLLGKLDMPISNQLKAPKEFLEEDLPSFGISILVPLIPAILMISTTIVKLFVSKDSQFYGIINFLGSADISMLIAVLVAMYVFGTRRGMDGKKIADHMTKAISGVSNVLLVISAGGAFKQVLLDSGVGKDIVIMMQHSNLSPLIFAWIITAIIRIITGQGAVAAITVAGIMQPMIGALSVNPVLMLLAIACGSNTITLMYDGGFLLFKETFGISMKDTFKTWGLLELSNSVIGLIVCLLLNLVI